MKKKTNPNINKKPLNKQRKIERIALVVAVVIIGIVAGLVITETDPRHIVYFKDKQRFETVAKSVKQLQNRLNVEAGPGVEWKFEKYCREGSVKFQKPLIGCDVETLAYKVVANEKQVNSLISKYESLFKSSRNFKFEEKFSSTPPLFLKS